MGSVDILKNSFLLYLSIIIAQKQIEVFMNLHKIAYLIFLPCILSYAQLNSVSDKYGNTIPLNSPSDFLSKVVNIDAISLPIFGLEGALRNPAKYYPGGNSSLSILGKENNKVIIFDDTNDKVQLVFGFSISVFGSKDYYEYGGYDLKLTGGILYSKDKTLTSGTNALTYIEPLVIGSAIDYKFPNEEIEINGGLLYYYGIAQADYNRLDLGASIEYKDIITISAISRNYTFSGDANVSDLIINYALNIMQYLCTPNHYAKNELSGGIIGNIYSSRNISHNYSYSLFDQNISGHFSETLVDKRYTPALFLRYFSTDRTWILESIFNPIDHSIGVIFSYMGLSIGIGYNKSGINTNIVDLPVGKKR